jgi:hypothetical protein
MVEPIEKRTPQYKPLFFAFFTKFNAKRSIRSEI